MKIPLIGPSYPAFSRAISAQKSENLYSETVETPEGKSKQVLRGRPGISLFKDLSTINAAWTPIRGLWSGGGRLFIAAGTKFGEVDISGALVGSLSTIANDNLPVDILPNGNQLFVVSGGLSYCNSGAGLVQNTLPTLSGKATHALGTFINWDSAANSVTGNTDTFDIGMTGQTIVFTGVPGGPYTVQSIFSPNLLTTTPNPGLFSSNDWSCTPVMNARRGTFLDGYFVVSRPSSRQFNISNLLDGATWDGLDYAYKEGYPDNLQAVWAEPPLLYLLGVETLEVWRNTGNASFPLERVDGGFSRVGLAATWSCASLMGRLHMLAGGSYGQVVAVRMDGTTPVRISSYALEEALKVVAFPNEGWSYTYVDRGHLFWVLYFGGINTWVFDATEAMHRPPQECWHERAMWDGAINLPYKAAFHTFLPEWNGGTHIVGDAANGKLYMQSSDYYDDLGNDIQYCRALAYVFNDNKRIYHHRLEVEMETGVMGTLTVEIDWSDDRGETFGADGVVGARRSLTAYKAAASLDYTTRFFTTRLGSSRGRIYRLWLTGKSRVAVADAFLEATLGTA